jgi:hypothetical protein
MKLPLNIKLLIIGILVLMALGTVNSTYEATTSLYNNTTTINLANDALIQKQRTNYDGYYQAFMEKQNNANINKEVFIKVTSIIMSSRKDGENLSWKWVSENQQIPYSEFTVFYKELSDFISERYKDNMAIEIQKQDLVRRHNLLISVYPNNLINGYILEIDKLTYKEGYVSDYTKNKFK